MKLIIAAQAKSELVRFARRSTNEMEASSGSPKSCDLSRTGNLFLSYTFITSALSIACMSDKLFKHLSYLPVPVSVSPVIYRVLKIFFVIHIYYYIHSLCD